MKKLSDLRLSKEYLYEMRRIVENEREKQWAGIAPLWVRALLDYIAELEDKPESLARYPRGEYFNSNRDTLER
jgi:hypothetical protein